ncbi:general odorant-binding protein 19d-like [Leptopilina heterotoma]|uniref:general odorant-binding protein 19d-like n=1 Tax=Leptopilina heterotoma TaxID=63436 RepID=UPI001CA85F58|nr:general odorant-binding protein 19d-like [Leptopilina heterotoma]
MKCLVLFTVVTVISVVNCIPHPPPPMTEEMKKNMDECRTELGISMEEERELHRNHDFKNEKLRCMPACLMKKDGVLQENKEINLDKLYEKAQRFGAVTDDVKKSIQECSEQAKSKADDCELAHTFMHCTHKAMGHGPGPKSGEEPN